MTPGSPGGREPTGVSALACASPVVTAVLYFE
jgi:hypothetical protein